MRVIVEFDPAMAGVSQAPPAAAVSERSNEALDGGSAPGSMTGGAGETPGSGDAGGPPQWLLDDVQRAMNGGNDNMATSGAEPSDGGGAQDSGAPE